MSVIVGVAACSKLINDEPQHSTPTRYGRALIGAADAVPVLLPPFGEAMLQSLDRLDGLLLSGSPSNVHPDLYGATESLTPDHHDEFRDRTTLPLAHEAIRRGMPLLAICRGIQELNVAMGGTLHQQVHMVEGRADHRAGDGELEYLFRLKHKVRFSGQLAQIVGTSSAMVNSLHEQALDRIAAGLDVEAVADDGTSRACECATPRASPSACSSIPNGTGRPTPQATRSSTHSAPPAAATAPSATACGRRGQRKPNRLN